MAAAWTAASTRGLAMGGDDDAMERDVANEVVEELLPLVTWMVL